MTALTVLLDQRDIASFLIANGLEAGHAPITHVRPQYETASGQPQVMLIIEVAGQKVLAKTTLQLLESACSSIRAASGVARSP